MEQINREFKETAADDVFKTVCLTHALYVLGLMRPSCGFLLAPQFHLYLKAFDPPWSTR